MLLALTGNALMFPRALFTRDIVWMAGSSWACVAGWGQLLSMVLGKSVVTGWVLERSSISTKSVYLNLISALSNLLLHKHY
jgi:hypothetical protein